MDTKTKYTKTYRERVKPFSESDRTLREDILRTSTDLYSLGKNPQLVNPTNGNSYVAVTGNRDKHGYSLNLVTNNESYGFEDCQVDRVKVDGLWLPRGVNCFEAEAMIERNPENLREYLQLKDDVILDGKNERGTWRSNGFQSTLQQAKIIPVSYTLNAENGEVTLSKIQGYEVLPVGYNLITSNVSLFGFRPWEDEGYRIKLEGILAETWDDLLQAKKRTSE